MRKIFNFFLFIILIQLSKTQYPDLILFGLVENQNNTFNVEMFDVKNNKTNQINQQIYKPDGCEKCYIWPFTVQTFVFPNSKQLFVHFVYHNQSSRPSMVRAQLYTFEFDENNNSLKYLRYCNIAMNFLTGFTNRGLDLLSYDALDEKIFYTTVDYDGYKKNLVNINPINGNSELILPAQQFWVQSKNIFHSRYKSWYSLFTNDLKQLVRNGRVQELKVGNRTMFNSVDITIDESTSKIYVSQVHDENYLYEIEVNHENFQNSRVNDMSKMFQIGGIGSTHFVIQQNLLILTNDYLTIYYIPTRREVYKTAKNYRRGYSYFVKGNLNK
jgi:hypothetical protein